MKPCLKMKIWDYGSQEEVGLGFFFLFFNIQKNENEERWGYISVLEYLPRMSYNLGSVSIQKKKKTERKKMDYI